MGLVCFRETVMVNLSEALKSTINWSDHGIQIRSHD